MEVCALRVGGGDGGWGAGGLWGGRACGWFSFFFFGGGGGLFLSGVSSVYVFKRVPIGILMDSFLRLFFSYALSVFLV